MQENCNILTGCDSSYVVFITINDMKGNLEHNLIILDTACFLRTMESICAKSRGVI